MNTICTSHVHGKIILTGEYAVVFGFPGIAVPAPLGMEVAFEKDAHRGELTLVWKGIKGDKWEAYARTIVRLCERKRGPVRGELTVRNHLPLGKGMGSSTALVIVIARCLIGEECRGDALAIEDIVNPGHSGLDFAVIWEQRPMLFMRERGCEVIDLPELWIGKVTRAAGTRESILSISSENARAARPRHHAFLIDTGMPNESTPELVAWMKSRRAEPVVSEALATIGRCTERLILGEDLRSILRDHHRAQVALGVVPAPVQTLIAKIEETGGAAKVLGAGGRTGGGGMVLALRDMHIDLRGTIRNAKYSIVEL